ncbi:MAG: hypothetical protein ABI830_09885 [Pseudolabrys sp.]
MTPNLWTAAPAILAALVARAPYALADDAAVSDAQALAISQKHCVMCHAAKPTDDRFPEAPKNVALETLADLKKHAQVIYVQTVQNKAMPLGGQTHMTDDERATLGRWVQALK